MGQCFLYGNGSAGAGLTIVSGLTEPVKPKENMIWVKSDKAGKKYVFAEVFPEAPADGTIVFLSKAKSIAHSTYVFTSGAWESVEASMYIGGLPMHRWVQRYRGDPRCTLSPRPLVALVFFTRRTKCLLTALPLCT